MIGGRYELEREIGRGGMGAVWLARDEVLGRPVAIKRTGLVPGSASADQARAEREARLAARLSHPNVVAVFDLVDEDDAQWLVMEHVDGLSLSALIDREGALEPDRAAALMAQAADALAAAHDAGIVHRDVKPSNMLVAPDGHLKLLDFGIARADSEKTLTATGLVTGSPAYLAPEVASGQGATTASDVWSLGASFFHALAGRPPYTVGDNLMGALYRIVHEDPPRLEDAGWLTPMLEGTMTKDVDQRWTMHQVRDFLVSGGASAPPVPQEQDDPGTRVMTPVSGPPDTPRDPLPPVGGEGEQRSRGRRRAWLPVLLVTAAVVVLAAVIGWALVSGDGGREQAAGPDSSKAAGSSAASGSSGSSGSSDPSESPTTKSPGPTEQGMEGFIADYLATAPSSPETTYDMLTPTFQKASGGFEGYSGFWNTIQSAELAAVNADPGAMTVSYTVDYVKEDGKSSTENVTLTLAFRDGRYLIADEN